MIPLWLTATGSAADPSIHKDVHELRTTPLITSNKEMGGIMKIVKSSEESGLLIKVVSQPIENEAKKQNGGFLSMLLCTLGASLLGNLLTGKGVMKVCEGTIIVGQDYLYQIYTKI